MKLELALFQSYHNFSMPNNELVINSKDAKINKRVVSGVIVLKIFPCSMRERFLRLFHHSISLYCKLHIGKVIKNVKHLRLAL